MRISHFQAYTFLQKWSARSFILLMSLHISSSLPRGSSFSIVIGWEDWKAAEPEEATFGLQCASTQSDW